MYFDISSLYAQGQNISSISTPVYYDAADQIDGTPRPVSAPVQWGDANSCVYYVTDQLAAATRSGCRRRGPSSSASTRRSGPNYKFYWNSAGLARS